MYVIIILSYILSFFKTAPSIFSVETFVNFYVSTKKHPLWQLGCDKSIL